MIYKLFKKMMLSVLVFISCFTNTVYAAEVEYGDGLFKKEEVEACSTSKTKTYMDYRLIRNKQSKQYKFIQEHMTVDQETGLLFDEYGFIGIALGSYFGEIGTRYVFHLEGGNDLYVVKIEAKSDNHVNDGCEQKWDKSVIEFVIDSTIAGDYYGRSATGYVSKGNFNHIEEFSGKIESIELLEWSSDLVTKEEISSVSLKTLEKIKIEEVEKLVVDDGKTRVDFSAMAPLEIKAE